MSSPSHIEGFSANNIWRMRAFYLAHVEVDTILAQPAQEIAEPSAILLGILWGHNITLIQKIKDSARRLWHPQLQCAEIVDALRKESWTPGTLHSRLSWTHEPFA